MTLTRRLVDTVHIEPHHTNMSITLSTYQCAALSNSCQLSKKYIWELELHHITHVIFVKMDAYETAVHVVQFLSLRGINSVRIVENNNKFFIYIDLENNSAREWFVNALANNKPYPFDPYLQTRIYKYIPALEIIFPFKSSQDLATLNIIKDKYKEIEFLSIDELQTSFQSFLPATKKKSTGAIANTESDYNDILNMKILYDESLLAWKKIHDSYEIKNDPLTAAYIKSQIAYIKMHLLAFEICYLPFLSLEKKLVKGRENLLSQIMRFYYISYLYDDYLNEYVTYQITQTQHNLINSAIHKDKQAFVMLLLKTNCACAYIESLSKEEQAKEHVQATLHYQLLRREYLHILGIRITQEQRIKATEGIMTVSSNLNKYSIDAIPTPALPIVDATNMPADRERLPLVQHIKQTLKDKCVCAGFKDLEWKAGHEGEDRFVFVKVSNKQTQYDLKNLLAQGYKTVRRMHHIVTFESYITLNLNEVELRYECARVAFDVLVNHEKYLTCEYKTETEDYSSTALSLLEQEGNTQKKSPARGLLPLSEITKDGLENICVTANLKTSKWKAGNIEKCKVAFVKVSDKKTQYALKDLLSQCLFKSVRRMHHIETIESYVTLDLNEVESRFNSKNCG